MISEIDGGQALERTLLDDDGLANFEVDLGVGRVVAQRNAGLFSLLLLEDRGEHGEDLVQAQRNGVVGVAHEAGDAGGVADDAPGGIRQVHADQNVAGDANAVDDLALSVLDLHDFFHGDLDLEDVIFHVQRLAAGLKVCLDAVFVAGVGVDDVPVTLLAAQLGLEFFGGVNVGLGAVSASASASAVVGCSSAVCVSSRRLRASLRRRRPRDATKSALTAASATTASWSSSLYVASGSSSDTNFLLSLSFLKWLKPTPCRIVRRGRPS